MAKQPHVSPTGLLRFPLSLPRGHSPHRIRTTAYHPCSNSLVERLHRQLKASLMAHLPQTHWIESLPLVLLGTRTALKEDIQHTSAELVYGTTLHLPGAFFPDSTTPDVTDTTSYVSRLKSEMNKLQATTPLSHVYPHTYVNPGLRPVPTSSFAVTRWARKSSHHTMDPSMC